MAKHAVPKKKQSTTRSGRRYHTFENLTRIKLGRMAQMTKCEACGAARVAHKACTACETYRGNSVSNKKAAQEAKITKVKA
ncbi:MAG: 50S ribosomal protein L32 [Candidatus Gracilibacteria bacterium]|jgi:ribosomal protein L32